MNGYAMVKYPTFDDKLPALAKRLGVEPLSKEEYEGRHLLSTTDDKVYDFFDLINAFLDKVG